MNMLNDIETDVEAFFEGVWDYIKAHVGQDLEEIFMDAVKAADLLDVPGEEKKAFAFSNIVAVVGKDLVADFLAMFNFGLEAAVQQMKAQAPVVEAIQEPPV
jgi:hypothetical protein